MVKINIAQANYSTVATHNLDCTLPDNCVIVRAWYYVVTTFTSGSGSDAATLQLGVNTDDATGIVAAIAISDVSNPWDAGLHEAVPDGTVANFTTQTTAQGRTIDLVIGVEALDAGEMNLFLEYVVTE
jgi:hypothetical protein